MASHPSGYKEELLTIETNKISLSIKGKNKTTDRYGNIARLKVICNEESKVDYKNDGENEDKFDGHQYIYSASIKPMFYEQTEYELVVVSKNNENISFDHDSPNIRDSVSLVSHTKENILTGMINFRNEVGLSDLVIKIDDKEYLRLVIEVFPSKIDYVKDYHELMIDITKEIYSLVFDFLKKTYSEYGLTDIVQQSQVEFYAIIRKLFNDMIQAIDITLRTPHHALETNHEIQKSYKAKRVDHQSIKWVQKHPEEVLKTNNGYLVNKTLAVKRNVTYDTRENRFIKYMIESTIRRLKQFENAYRISVYEANKQGSNKEVDDVTIKELDSMIRAFQLKLNEGYLKDIPSSANLNSMSLVFLISSGYRDLYKAYLMLSKGLSITSNMFNISTKDISRLYEYWCFIKLNSLLKDKYKLESSDIINASSGGFITKLVMGKDSQVTYSNPNNDDQIIIRYNQTEQETPTTSQKPDNVLSLVKKKPSMQYEYVFDAKYKIDMANDNSYYKKHYKTPGPKEEDINTMHRYRDAIVGKDITYHRNMFGAFVLFPYNNEEEFKNHQFYKSIEDVNIGAFPFLPSSTKLISDFLDQLILEDEKTRYDKSVLQKGLETYMKIDGLEEYMSKYHLSYEELKELVDNYKE